MKLIKKSINYLKAVAAETISNAKSGHTGVVLGAAPILFTLFKDHYNFDISDPEFINRDRFVMSAGHGSALYYTLLSMFGFDVSIQDLKEFRKLGSRTPGHPEIGITSGVEASTGMLGQGVANAVGMALANSILAEKFNSVGQEIITNHVYCFCGDGDLMEGVAQEAASLAGTLALKKLILLYDSNDVTIDGSLDLANRENTAAKFRAMKWRVIKVDNGENPYAISRAIKSAKKSTKPTIIIFKTIIGQGTERAGTSVIHGVALSKEELDALKKKLGVKESFYFPGDVRDLCMASARKGKLNHEKWNQDLAVFQNTHPDLFKQFESYFDKGRVDYEKILKGSPKWDGLKRGGDLNSIILNEIAEKMPCLIAGTADLAPSIKCYIDGGGNYAAGNRRGRNIHFGVREHAMAAISNGIALYDDFVVQNATYLSFANHMIPSIRMAAIMDTPVMFLFTHDSVYVGEDGPTHQPIEQLSQLRSIIGNTVFRPADGKELLAAYQYAITNRGPVCLVLPRQSLNTLSETSFGEASFGGYIVKDVSKADVVLYATGSEVSLALEVASELNRVNKLNVSVVSFPSLEVFEEQSDAYKQKVLQKQAKLHVAIEASNDSVWYKYLNDKDFAVLVNKYAGSGAGKDLYVNAGFSVKEIAKNIVTRIR